MGGTQEDTGSGSCTPGVASEPSKRNQGSLGDRNQAVGEGAADRAFPVHRVGSLEIELILPVGSIVEDGDPLGSKFDYQVFELYSEVELWAGGDLI